jgi:hypothetical protein
MRLLVLLSFIILLSPSINAQNNNRLSEMAQVSIITMGPFYGELYAAFGHSAIRVFDPVNNIDLAYNYGTFDFDQPNFYLNFARGNLLYKLAVQDYQRLRQYYIYYNRFIHEQVLDLNLSQEQEVFDFLQNNAMPENANYYYDYFYDNCASRIRDVFEQSLGSDFEFDGSYIKSERSIRELTDDYLIGHYPWGDLGIDFCLGLPMDKILKPREYMFLPDYIESGFDNAWLNDKPIVRDKIVVFEPENVEEKKTIVTPSLVFLTLLVIVAFTTRRHLKMGKRGHYLDASIFIVIGLLGIFLTLLWFATDHRAASSNLNIIWAFPVHLIAGIILLKGEASLFWRKYFKVIAIVMTVLLVVWPVLPQMMPTSLMFVSAVIMIRAAYIGWGAAYMKYSLTKE